MSQQFELEAGMSRRSFISRGVMLGGAVALGGGALLEGCGQQQYIENELLTPQTVIVDINDGATNDGLQPAVRLNPPAKQPDPSTQNIRELYNPGALYRRFDVGGQKLVTLTLDDGPWPINTVSIMDTLSRNGLEGCATFFQVGDNMVQFLDIGKEVRDRGYLIGNHSKTHSTYVPSRIAAEISPAQQQFLDYLGLTPNIFRSPGLTEGQIIQDVLASLGMCNIFTDTDPHDWAMPRLTSQEIIMNVSNQLHPGLILLLHDGGSHTQTVNAMQGIIDVANAQGYTFVTMKQMMQAAKGAVFTTQHAELYEPRPVMPDYSLDTFDRVNELARIGLTAS